MAIDGILIYKSPWLIYPITYTSKSKGKLQTPAVTPKKIQPPTWKKTKIESLTDSFYHYTLGSVINITSTSTSTSNVISTFGQLLFQTSKSKKEEEESEDQEFTYQNPITENPEVETPNLQAQQKLTIENSEIGTPNQQRQNNSNPELINPQNLPPPPQQFNLDPMAYAPIAKLDNFTSEENDAQVWLNNVEKAIAVNRWNNTRAIQAISYFLKDTTNLCNNNNINCLVNTFTTMKQGETEAVTTYLGCFYRNLCQIQAINANYFTAPQILNQFIWGLRSSILQHVRPLYLGTL
ncbi:hypothetical protein G9A89_006406 [Geosiphon pyriformis]|nr:hypothetical protein G9A89_006406 [Geosiphon pyriformis]